MANRTMQAKRLKLQKQKRMRRAYLKSYFGTIKVGQSVDKSKVPRGAEGIFDYRQRGSTYWDDYLETKFPSRGMVSEERSTVLDKLYKLTSEVIPENNVVVRRGGITKTTLRFYFSSDYTSCTFIQVDLTQMCVFKSKTYCGQGARDRAYFDLEHNRIEWWDRVDLTPLKSDGAHTPEE